MCSCGDAVAGFGGSEAAVAVIAVAVGDVAGQREGEGVPVQVVGVGHDELVIAEKWASTGLR